MSSIRWQYDARFDVFAAWVDGEEWPLVGTVYPMINSTRYAWEVCLREESIRNEIAAPLEAALSAVEVVAQGLRGSP